MRFVAIGDSFTEGVGDERPDGTPRGWSDLTAQALAADAARTAAPPVQYANLAIRGRLMNPIVGEQLPAALALEPDLLTFNGGGNDVMRPGRAGDLIARLTAQTETAIRACAEAGVRIVVVSGADPSDHLPLGSVIRRRCQLFSVEVARLCERHGVAYCDNFADVEMRRSAYWSPDRLHLNAAGHRRVAARLLDVLGVPAPAGWGEDLPGTDPRRRLGENARYYQQFVLPWVQRRVGGRSSGDGREPKHAAWFEVDDER